MSDIFQETLHTLYPGSVCRAVHDYEVDLEIRDLAKRKEELEFRARDIILILDEKSRGPYWMVGCLESDRTKTGLFSLHFVHLLDQDEDKRVSRPECRAMRDRDIGLDYARIGKKELQFKKGDVILILDEEKRNGKIKMLYGCLKADMNERGFFSYLEVEFL